MTCVLVAETYFALKRIALGQNFLNAILIPWCAPFLLLLPQPGSLLVFLTMKRNLADSVGSSFLPALEGSACSGTPWSFGA